MTDSDDPWLTDDPDDDGADATPFRVKMATIYANPDTARKATLSDRDNVQSLRIDAVQKSVWSPDTTSDATFSAQTQDVYDTLEAIAPRDEFKRMLAQQLMACHNAAMECYRRAMLPTRPS